MAAELSPYGRVLQHEMDRLPSQEPEWEKPDRVPASIRRLDEETPPSRLSKAQIAQIRMVSMLCRTIIWHALANQDLFSRGEDVRVLLRQRKVMVWLWAIAAERDTRAARITKKSGLERDTIELAVERAASMLDLMDVL